MVFSSLLRILASYIFKFGRSIIVFVLSIHLYGDTLLYKFTIKRKMFVIFLSTLIGFAVLLFLIYHTESSITKNENLVINIEKLKIDMLMLRRHEKDFLLRKNLKYRDKFLHSYRVAVENAHFLQKELSSAGFHSNEASNYIEIIKKYRDSFLALVQEQVLIGLNEKKGLYGALRESVHKVQNYAKSLHNWELLARVYELRKNEKDFMLRKDLEYIKEHKEHFEALLPLVHNTKMVKYLKIYQKDLMNLVEAEVKIGLNEKIGMRGVMRNTIHKTERLLQELEKSTMAFGSTQRHSILMISFSVALFFIVMLLFINLLISNNFIHSINKLKIGLLNFFNFLDKKRDSIETIEVDSNDEIGRMAQVLNKHIEQTIAILKSEKDSINRSISTLEKMVYTDSLTKTYTRQKLINALEKEKENKKRYGDHVSLIMFDIDHFKKINDTYGHVVGDKVLITLAKIIKNNLRINDIFSRWGGEEFLILLPRTDIDAAYTKANQLRQILEEYEDEQIPKFTASFGVTEILESDKDESCFIRVDKALYLAKRKRNDVVKLKGE